jgi:2'-hydroxyisoflavone reductase
VKVLVVGGTQFIGRHVVEGLLRAGDEVTLFHRGRTNPGLFPEATHIRGDRDVDLSALAGREWDATIDTSAYVPRQVRTLAKALGGRGGTYVHVSSVSAYADPLEPGFTEDAPLATLDDPTVETVTAATYGGLKALCERAAQESFSDVPVVIVRPTYVVGPLDHTHRFTWWVEMVARGGSLVVPGPADNPFQVVDGRDLAAFMVLLAHRRAPGTYHTVSPRTAWTFSRFLECAAEAVGPAGGTELVWAPPSVLTEVGVSPAALPLWAGDGPERWSGAADPERAYKAGLTPRPLRDTIVDTHAWALECGYHPSVGDGFGLSAEQERQVRARLSTPG